MEFTHGRLLSKRCAPNRDAFGLEVIQDFGIRQVLAAVVAAARTTRPVTRRPEGLLHPLLGACATM